MNRIWIFSAIILLLSGHFFSAIADYLEDAGYHSLSDSLAGNPPTGAAVLGMHVEAALPSGAWMPDPTDTKLQGRTFYDMSGAGGSYSSHATGVGRLFYGNDAMASGMSEIYCYNASHWVDTGFLHATEYRQPDTTDCRVANHSWIGSSSGYAADMLRRADWVIHRDELVQVAATCSTASPLMGAAYNGVAVGRTAGETGTGTGYVDGDYTAGRPVPHIVIPFGSLSSATPPVAAAAALLIQTAHEQTDLSDDPAVDYTTSRTGNRIYNAERAEVVKAILMAGAKRFTKNTTSWDIIDYRSETATCTENGLDKRYGAGQLNVFDSYLILTGGEQNSKEDNPSLEGVVTMNGFDYDPYFGGANSSNETASYYLTADESHSRLSASLVWHIAIDGGTRFFFDGSAVLYDLDLMLFDVTDPGAPVLLACSSARGVNNENLWAVLEPGRTYCIQVRKGDNQSDFSWDYALAWQVLNDGDGDDISDYWEIAHGLNPYEPGDGAEDPDLDTLANVAEFNYGTSPLDSDSDDDGFDDAVEIANGFDPLDPVSHPPLEIPGQGRTGLVVVFGALVCMGLFRYPHANP